MQQMSRWMGPTKGSQWSQPVTRAGQMSFCSCEPDLQGLGLPAEPPDPCLDGGEGTEAPRLTQSLRLSHIYHPPTPQ